MSKFSAGAWLRGKAVDDGGKATFVPEYGGYQETFDLVSNGAAAGNFPTNAAIAGGAGVFVYGGDYAWSITGTIGTNVQLQTLARDGATWTNYLAPRTTNDGAATPPGATLATFGSNTYVRAVVTGTPIALYVSLNRIPV